MRFIKSGFLPWKIVNILLLSLINFAVFSKYYLFKTVSESFSLCNGQWFLSKAYSYVCSSPDSSILNVAL